MAGIPSPASPAPDSAQLACRNCGAAAPGTYCPQCGQETSLALPTVRALLREAAGRYVAFDGRMWRTLDSLLLRPGFLTREYLAGRRRRYIRPARLFLVLSIGLFALLRFEGKVPPLNDLVQARAEQRKAALAEANADVGTAGLQVDSDFGLHLGGKDALLNGTALDQLGGRWLAPVRQRAALFNQLPRQQKAEQLFSGMLRYGPYAMFALLPLFALLLKLVYTGRSRRYPERPRRYAAHLVFGAHNHAFLFFVVALLVLLPEGPWNGALGIWAVLYLLLSMRAVYGGRWSGVLARASVITLIYVAFFALVMVGLVVAAILLR